MYDLTFETTRSPIRMTRDDDEGVATDRAREIERAVLAHMQGAPVDDRHLDDDARTTVSRIMMRFMRTRDAETVPIALADGSHLPLSRAERVLAEKESDRAFAPLARLVRRHERDARHADPVPYQSPSSAVSEAMAAVAADIATLGPAAREAMAALGHVPWRIDGDHLARALSLPVPEAAFLDDRARTLLRAARSAFSSVLVRPLAALKVPRFFTPCVIVHDDTVRCGVRETARARPFMALLDDGARALLAATRKSGFTTHESALAFALASALAGVGARRRALDDEKRTAELAARVVAATTVLRIETALTIARATDESDGDLAHVHDAVSSVMGAPLEEMVFELIGPALDGFPDRTASRAHQRIVDVAHGALFGLALRDRKDEIWPLAAQVGEAVAELQNEALPAPRQGALVDLLGPLL